MIEEIHPKIIYTDQTIHDKNGMLYHGHLHWGYPNYFNSTTMEKGVVAAFIVTLLRSTSVQKLQHY